MCKSNRGKRLVLFFLSHFSRNLLQCSPLGDTACGSVLFGSSFRCSDEHASPLCYWIFSLRLRKKDKCLIITFLFLFLFAKHFGVAWEEGKLYMNNDLVLRVGFFTGISRAFFHSFLESPFRCCCNFSWEILGVLEQRIHGIREFYMAHVCGLDTAA